jgi:hypothetical protein
MLIDQNGKIVYASEHINRYNKFEQDFEDLLAGKEITVEKKEEPNRKELSQD